VNPVFLIFKIWRSVGFCFLKFKNRTVEGVVMSGIEDCLAAPSLNKGEGLRVVCIRETLRDLKESAKLLIEDELQEFGDLQGKIYRNLGDSVGKASATIWAVRLGFLVGRSPSDDGDATVDFISLFPTVPWLTRNLDSPRRDATQIVKLMFGSDEFDMAGKPAKIRTRDLFPAICAAQRAGLKEICVRLNDGINKQTAAEFVARRPSVKSEFF
jgi:hypothetical protein